MFNEPKRADKPNDALKRKLLKILTTGLIGATSKIFTKLIVLGGAFSLELFNEIVCHSLIYHLLKCGLTIAIAATLYLANKLKKRASKNESDHATLLRNPIDLRSRKNDAE